VERATQELKQQKLRSTVSRRISRYSSSVLSSSNCLPTILLPSRRSDALSNRSRFQVLTMVGWIWKRAAIQGVALRVGKEKEHRQ
jgi:hypothetical protein